MPVHTEGPFRESCPTPDAIQAKERQASLERVARLTQAAVEQERAREVRVDSLTFGAVAVSLLATGGTLGLALLDPRGPWLSFLCLASSLLVSAAIALFHRSRVRHRRRRI